MAPWGNFVLDKGFNAAAAITKYRAVKLVATNGSEAVTPVTASADITVGVAQFGVTAPEIAKGKGASIRMAGVTPMELSGTVTRGQEVMAHTDGTARVAATVGNRVIGLALDGGASGDRIPVLLYTGQRVL
jgi:uncharacterized protein DUF2190